MSKKDSKEEIQEELSEEKLTTEETAEEKEPEIELTEEERLSQELAEQKDKFIRLYSEFENFRRRTAKEKVDIVMNASESLIKELLPVVDDFERAQHSFDNAKDIEAIKEGVELIFGKLKRTLESKGLKPMEAKETDFDAELHECITQFDGGEDKKGKVIDEVEKGYYLNDKVIRYAKVVVGS
ncbi:nucleotide exchange factor GrpE [Jiulongibacter sp. NS-SX5]|uniref:nucleotide exchange factor GrpE n=1 Tax=Jiulongibacter sp. NS-SX5 TaxID=3463854 RepID=UPI004058B5CD